MQCNLFNNSFGSCFLYATHSSDQVCQAHQLWWTWVHSFQGPCSHLRLCHDYRLTAGPSWKFTWLFQALSRPCSLVLDSLQKMRQMRWTAFVFQSLMIFSRSTSERSPAMSCKRFACTSHTKPGKPHRKELALKYLIQGTPTHPPKSLSSQFPPRLHLNCSWLQTSLTAEALLAFSTLAWVVHEDHL